MAVSLQLELLMELLYRIVVYSNASHYGCRASMDRPPRRSRGARREGVCEVLQLLAVPSQSSVVLKVPRALLVPIGVTSGIQLRVIAGSHPRFHKTLCEATRNCSCGWLR